MANVKRQRYDIAINGQGFILAQKPEQPALKARQNDIFSQRIAQGDRDYNDFISWWYLAQTDWFAGFKDVVAWADDSHFYYSTNIDTFSEPGAFKLHQAPILQNTFTPKLFCGMEATVNSATDTYFGADNTGGSRAIIFKNASGSWTDITTASWTTAPTLVSQINNRNNYLWAHNLCTSATWVVAYYDGTTWTDATANLVTKVGYNLISSRCSVVSGSGSYYTFVDLPSSKSWNMVKCTVDNPTAAGDWTILITKTNTTDVPIACCEYKSKIYYLLSKSNATTLELRVYDPAASSDTSVGFFNNTTAINWGSNNLLQVLQQNLIIICPTKEIWSYDGTALTRIYRRDDNKNSLTAEAYAYLVFGGVINDNKLYTGNLINDGTYSHNWIKDANDSSSETFYPLFSDSGKNIWGTDTVNPKILYKITSGGSTYKSASGKNFIVFNNFDKVSGIDKLAFKITFVFKTLVSGQSITWEYLLNELTSNSTWTSLGSASFANDGAVTSKDLYFGDNVIFKKIWFRAKLDGGGSNTPVVYDAPVFAYLPMPDYKLHWEFTVKCQNKIKRKDQTKEVKDALWLKNFLQQAWLTKSIVAFEDYDSMVVDYVSGNPLSASNTTITVTGSTDSFPEFGRLLIENEEIFYSGKNKNQFLNCTRGQRGTLAATHALNTAITMAHRVIIRNYQENLLIANDPLDTEYHVSLSLQEV